MDHATFDRFLALNSHLTALAAAGVPLHLGPRAGDTGAELERVSAEVALEVGRGSSLETVLDGEQRLPVAYRCAMLASLRSDDPVTVLEALHQPATVRQHLQRSTSRLLTGPLILFLVAFAAFIYLCLYVTPRLHGMYEQVNQAPSAPVAFLVAARLWLPYWGPLVPLVLLIGVGLSWSSHGVPRVGWIPRAQRYRKTTGHATFARQLARLVEHGIPLSDALPIAAGQIGDKHLASAASVIADAARLGNTADAQHPELQHLPPLLRWSLTSQTGLEKLATNLRFAAGFYHRSVERRIDRIQSVLAVVGTAFLGGATVLAYGLAVFLPIVQLLVDLSS